MSEDLRKKADELFEAALEETGARDPRDFYRDLLRRLKGEEGSGESGDVYEDALDHFNDVLVPGIASGELEPLRAWRDFGLRLADLTAEGRPVEIDGSGFSRPFDPDADRDRLILHLPKKGSERALLVALPKDPTPAQKAAYDLLVAGKQTL